LKARSDWTAWSISSRTHRWKRRKRKRNEVARAWMWFLAVLAGAGVLGVLAWQVHDQVRTSVANGNSVGEAALSVIRGAVLAPWQQDVLESLDKSTEEVGVGEVTQAEIAVDRAASILTAARLKSQHSDPEFFQRAITGLDRIWNQRPGDDRLFAHVTQARIELAMLRSAQGNSPPAANASSIAPGGKQPSAAPAADSRGGNPAGRLALAAPREIAANFVLNPASLGGSYLDATRLPDAAEILLPPARRSLDDGVRVEDLTIAGASQTLDSIHWSNVTFVGTRLRYEKGPLDLSNVRFVGCTFGFPADERGSRLANAIALAQTSFTSD